MRARRPTRRWSSTTSAGPPSSQEIRGLKTDPFSPKFQAGHIIHGTEGFIAESSLFDPDGNLVRTFEGRPENHFANFIKAVRNGRRDDLNADILEGHQSTALCHVGNISHRLGRPERVEVIARRLEDSRLDAEVGRTFERMTRHLRDNGVDLERNQLSARSAPAHRFRAGGVLDHPDADALLTREYRRPFVVPAEDQV